jgi:hypothetical protein
VDSLYVVRADVLFRALVPEERRKPVISSLFCDILTAFFTAARKFFMGRGPTAELTIDVARTTNDEPRSKRFA